MEIEMTVALVSAGVALTIALLTAIYNRAALREKRVAEKRHAIAKKLNEFYGPFISYSNVTKALFKIFRAGKPAEFRTLTYLLDPDQDYETPAGRSRVVLTDNDRKILEELLNVEVDLEKLVIEKGGLVDDKRLMFDYIPDPVITDVGIKKGEVSLLALLIAHFRVLRLAYQGGITGEVGRYKDFVYPREIDGVIKERFDALHAELEQLGSDKIG